MTKQMTEQKEEQKKLFLAILVMTVAVYAVNFFFPDQEQQVIEKTKESIEKNAVVLEEKELPTPIVAQTDVQNAEMQSDEAQSDGGQVLTPAIILEPQVIKNNYISGLVDVAQGRVSQLDLLKYKETLEKDSPVVRLLSDDYYSTLSWGSDDVKMPFENGLKEAVNHTIAPNQAQTYVFENDAVRLERTITVDEKYMITVSDKMTNLTDKSVNVYQTGSLNRRMKEKNRVSNVHEGFVAYADNKLREEKYTSVDDDSYHLAAKSDWFGFTDKYWEAIMIFADSQKVKLSFKQTAGDWYIASFKTNTYELKSSESLTKTTRLFAGAKDVNIIDAYQKELNIPRFDLSIDFGWYPFLTRPFLYMLNWLYGFIGNMGVAILVFATLIRLALLPIAQKSYESMAKMRKIQPQLKTLQARFKNDPRRLQMETMNLYKRSKVNPASGCLPIFLQIPVFFALYKVLSISINMRQAPFFGWIQDLSIPDPATILTGFGYFDWSVPSIFNIGIWPILMGCTMYVQQKLSPAPTDPTQAKVLKFLPIIFTFMLGGFASGLVIYWTWSNLLSIAQQKYIMKKVGVK